MLIDQLKEISIAGELDIVETANWNPKVTRRDYMVGLENTGSAVVDDPDQQLYESYACESERNFTGYCNHRLEDLFHRQSRETDPQRRRELVWDIDRTLQEEGARPVIFHTRGATCWQPQVKGLTTMVNSMVNGWRMETFGSTSNSFGAFPDDRGVIRINPRILLLHCEHRSDRRRRD